MTRTTTLLFLVFLLAVLAVRPALAQIGPEPVIKTPGPGDVLQGTITITGSDAVAGFLSSELAFAYVGDVTATWFPIAVSSSPVEAGTLATWDTNTITDGNYSLRLRVYLDNGTSLDVMVSSLRVRNYTAIETPTPGPTAVKPTLTPTVTLTPTPFPTPTALPPNPAVLTSVDVSTSIAYGGAAAMVILFVIGTYLWLRRK